MSGLPACLWTVRSSGARSPPAGPLPPPHRPTAASSPSITTPCRAQPLQHDPACPHSSSSPSPGDPSPPAAAPAAAPIPPPRPPRTPAPTITFPIPELGPTPETRQPRPSVTPQGRPREPWKQEQRGEQIVGVAARAASARRCDRRADARHLRPWHVVVRLCHSRRARSHHAGAVLGICRQPHGMHHEARLNLSGSLLAAKSLKYFASASRVIIEDSTLPTATRNMVMLRASQINGCGFCTDIHAKDPRMPGRPGCASTWSRPGGSPRCSPTPSAPRWS